MTTTRVLFVDRRPVGPRDRDFQRRLLADSRDDLLTQPPDTRDLMIDIQLRLQRRRLDLEHPTAKREILVTDDCEVGQLVTETDLAAIVVVDLLVLSSFRGRGVGTAVLARLHDDADATGRVVRLHDCTADAGLRRLGERTAALRNARA